MDVSELITPGAVLTGVKPTSKEQCLDLLARHAAGGTGIAADIIAAALKRREALGSTGIGSGIAMPHAPLAGLSAPFGLLAHLAKPVQFDAVDGEPVDIVCLILTPEAGQGQHLNALACVARCLQRQEVREAIRRGRRPQDVHAALCKS
ncbi:PTS sugar transporter subunit IIA [Bosea sp. F3-2]|jgi:PTS system nitrogen regulatory IIA component|uniref:PTS sugar transporter subunit IIA n=1 Tax=Bosea sp. F3-2 TaxID=2599640 RepID=UPI0011ECC51C|nr:PTS sugar transporter subunit IIA [Bosea sp. F3-2]QEL25254.1 PTS sugar transporter subunit IIA [Bosea sp. F3-2]